MKSQDKFYIKVGKTNLRQYVEPIGDLSRHQIKFESGHSFWDEPETRLSYYGAYDLGTYFRSTISTFHNLETGLDEKLEVKTLENHFPDPK